ncbi:GTP cyclohydrolase II [Rhodoblastus acidophilus]|uniref:GTP cyclohydrolase II RibA n=1 Tax=Rhodoblastus acidophilus TaxID=1074 RepID=UPI001FEE8029|nr:GTP cyclohydrolase II RibA [Rhodoblastus acidophilus]MCW2272996.1 GTP cyclohydrolase II [Rhodoblastus acidophilus]
MYDISGLFPANESSTVSVERGVAELRAGRPVVLAEGAQKFLVYPAEQLDEHAADVLDRIGGARLILTMQRLGRLGVERDGPGLIALQKIDIERITALILDEDARIDAPVSNPVPAEEAALDLLRLAHLLPAAILIKLDAPVAGLNEVAGADIRAFRARKITSLRLIGRAPVPLEGAPNSEIAVFRGGEGLRDQAAVIVGDPDLSGPVHVRLHSACLTGDLFGSLKCDCGDQLRHTAKFMAENGGGVILYLDQEGRGNGLANKVRAYGLQAKGHDTYDADEILGFGLDQRRFGYAARMLDLLGVTRVRLMTNNPKKIEALRAAGLEVSDQRIQGRPTPENIHYLATKRDRAGHFLDVDVPPSAEN